MVPPAQPRSYYGLPIVATPVWKPEVPWYFVVGGMAGAAAPLAAAARASGNVALAQRASAVALAGAAISPVLLIADLGRPERFHHMLRVVKPTSPMNVGTWVLSAFGATSAVSAGWQLLGVVPKAAGAPAMAAAGLLGPVLSTYTAVLIANTAVPAWHEARRELPFVFAGSSLAAAGGACLALTPVSQAAPARAMAAGGALLELTADVVMERRLEPVVRRSYERSPVRALHAGARACAIAGGADRGARRRAFADRGGGRRVAARRGLGAAALGDLQGRGRVGAGPGPDGGAATQKAR